MRILTSDPLDDQEQELESVVGEPIQHNLKSPVSSNCSGATNYSEEAIGYFGQ
jgi:hypothetical protein